VRDEERLDAEISDVDLVQRGQEGDERAFGILVKRHHESAYRVAVSLVRDGDLAQDVVQDAFLSAFRALDRFRGDASFRTWLLTITANVAKGALRRRGRRKETGFEEAGPISSRDLDPAESTVASLEAERARAMLETLPEKQRLSVALRIEEGLSFREIGEIIGSTEGAARVNYFHGIRKLRELME
jgi:RNA polymerase sigma-70 factor (ECF subfamily)